MLTFTIAIFLMIITPGPGVLSLAATGSGFGWKAGVLYLAGLFIGTNTVLVFVVTGFKGFLFEIPWVEPVFLIISLSYLTWIAWRIASAGNEIKFKKSKNEPTFFEAIFLQIINPKAYLVNGILFAGFPLKNFSLQQEILIKALIINLVWIPVHFFWLWLGIKLRQWGLNKGKQAIVNKVMAFCLLVVIGLAAFSEV
tara:strand:- start:158 stop:748 length:591 start_codon:yes stop_codon:yes gene_type:complete